jgi:hypothetical protein
MKEAQVGQWIPGTRKVVRRGDGDVDRLGMFSGSEVVSEGRSEL